MFNRHDLTRNEYMLTGPLRRKGYDWWWHSFTGRNERTGEEKAFFIEFFVCNPALGGSQPVLGQLPDSRARGLRPSYLMVKAGCWGPDACQLHRFYPWTDVLIHTRAPYSVATGECLASETELRGRVEITPAQAAAHPEWMCGAGTMTWDLTLDKAVAFHVGYGASRFFRTLQAFEMYWHAEGMKTLYAGTVTLNGERYTVTPETSYGYADKNWGRDFTSPWVWLSSCCMKSRLTGEPLNNSVFDIGGGRPKVWFLPLDRKLLGGFYYEGTEYEFNFSKFWTRPKTEFSARETAEEVLWHVRQENRRAVMITDVQCRKADMLLVNYESPDGAKRHNRLWNGGTGTGRVQLYRKKGRKLERIDDIDVTHIGCEYGEYDR